MAQIPKNFKWWHLVEKSGAFLRSKINFKGEFKMQPNMLV